MIPRRFFWLFDFLVLSASFLAAYWLFPPMQSTFGPGGPLLTPWLEDVISPAAPSGDLPSLLDLLWIFFTMAPTVLLTLAVLGGHRPLLDQSRTRIVACSIGAPFAGLSVIALAVFALKDTSWSRLFIFSFALYSTAALALYRLLLRRYLLFQRATGAYAKNVLLIGPTPSIEWIACYLAESVPSTDHRLAGYLRIQPDQVPPEPSRISQNGAEAMKLELLGDVQELGNLLIHRPIHEVIAVPPSSGGEWIAQVIQECDYFEILLRIVPEALLLGDRRALRLAYPFGGLQLPAVVLAPRHWESEALFCKRMVDVFLSSVLLIALFPLFVLIALAIKMTTPRLPVFYPWRVVGQNGVEFTGYKFTTMIESADDRKAELMSRNEMSGPVFKLKDDPRVIPLGRLLRKYSLNELPQLWSVLKGDMSLVGPRPAFRHELERYEFWHKRKLSIKPGITCLWQVSGRNTVNRFDDWVKMDLEYIDNWSLWLDFKILVRTIRAVFAGTGW